MAMQVTVKLPRPHKKQLQFIRCKAKRVVVKAGRRGGKTVGVAIFAVEKFLEGRRVLYAAPTQEQIDRFWSVVTNVLKEATANGVYYKNETRHVIELPGTEQRIRAKTAWDADSLRGDYADVLILDEWQLMNEDAWGVVGAPMLLDNDGIAIFVFTPPSFRTAGTSKAKDKKHANKLFRRAQADKRGRWRAFHFTSHDNPHISKNALSELSEDMSALTIRQEIMAEDIEEIPGALWKRAFLDKYRVSAIPNLTRICVAVDPKTEESANSEAGIIVVGLGEDKHGYVIDDASLNGSPEKWASQVVSAFHRWEANFIVAEVNQGGDMVVTTIGTVEKNLPIRKVHSRRGKYIRAEPVAVLYEKGRVHHVGDFPFLEEQLCSWVPGDKSPDRLDALVHGVTELMISGRSGWSRGASG